MALRQTTGFVESLLRLIGLDWTVPDYSTLSRRQKTLVVNIPYRGSHGPLNLLIDSTGIKVDGVRRDRAPVARRKPAEREWHSRKHGGAKRRLWRKIHLGVDEQTLEIRAIEITGSQIGDAPMLPELLDQIPPDVEIGSVTADGAFTTRASAMTPLTAATAGAQGELIPSSRPARTPSRGSHRPPGRSPGTRLCVPRNTSVGPSGENGADTTAEAAPRRRCIA